MEEPVVRSNRPAPGRAVDGPSDSVELLQLCKGLDEHGMFVLGMVFSAFAAGYVIFQFLGGVFGDKFGPRFTN